MKITRYFGKLIRLIKSDPNVITFEIYEDARTNYEGFIKAKINFVGNSFLEFREYVNTGGSKVKTYAYSYHYQKSDKLVFRYDNTPHHPQIESFPHHKHLAQAK